mgnify:CR=1 FL=1
MLTSKDKFFIGAIGSLAPAIVLLTKLNWSAFHMPVVGIVGYVLTYLLLAAVTGFVTSYYDEQNGLKLFWVGVTFPSLVLNVTAKIQTPGTQESSLLTVFAADHITVKGIVSGFQGQCPHITFKVNGQQVQASDQTRFDVDCSDIKDGATVKVKAEVMNNAGALQAGKVEDTLNIGGTVNDRSGDCPQLSMKIDGVLIKTDGSTRFERGSCPDLNPGADVKITLRRGDRAQASKVELVSSPSAFDQFWEGVRRALGR